ncbi:hypothetical protein [Oceanobacillus oncorhynchi]|uniref:hypothetical protein n=1 Tax=Oceanobacillus oncorhynchi TaxID=545501 RepID=UPI001868F28D|nr:hypothetical protein [Oceanobacillus oncorhynchi]
MNLVKKGEFYQIGNKLTYINKEKKIAFEIQEKKELVEKIIKLSNGYYSINEIVNILEDSSTYEVINELIKNEILKEENMDLKVYMVTSSIKDRNNLDQLTKYINYTGIDNISELNDAKLIVAYAKDSDDEFYYKVNKESLLNNIPWVKFSYDNNYVRFGPSFFHDGGPCYECMRLRISANERSQPAEKKKINNIEPSEILTPIIKNEIIRLSSESLPTHLFNREVSLNMSNYETSTFHVLAMPNCEVCANRRKIYG